MTRDEETTRWANLWRRTDYLGFPVVQYRDEARPSVDRLAEEVDTSRAGCPVQTHSGYPRVAAYRDAFDALAGAQNGSAESGPTPD